MIAFTDDEIDLFAQTLHAGYFADCGESSLIWEKASTVQRGNWRRAARALIRHLYHGQPVNKAPLSEAAGWCWDVMYEHDAGLDWVCIQGPPSIEGAIAEARVRLGEAGDGSRPAILKVERHMSAPTPNNVPDPTA